MSLISETNDSSHSSLLLYYSLFYIFYWRLITGIIITTIIICDFIFWQVIFTINVHGCTSPAMAFLTDSFISCMLEVHFDRVNVFWETCPTIYWFCFGTHDYAVVTKSVYIWHIFEWLLVQRIYLRQVSRISRLVQHVRHIRHLLKICNHVHWTRCVFSLVEPVNVWVTRVIFVIFYCCFSKSITCLFVGLNLC